jgi:hypothetical protein
MNIVSPEITSSVSVRRLTVQDASSVAELSSQLGYPSSSEDLRQRLEQISRSSDRIALGAVLNGQLVGWIDASVERHLQSPESVVIGDLSFGTRCVVSGLENVSAMRSNNGLEANPSNSFVSDRRLSGRMHTGFTCEKVTER